MRGVRRLGKRVMFDLDDEVKRTSSHSGGAGSSRWRSRSKIHTALMRESRTLKRAMTEPRIFSGIGCVCVEGWPKTLEELEEK